MMTHLTSHTPVHYNFFLHYGQMLKADDKQKFVDAMEQEMEGLRDIFKVVPRDSIPPETKPLPAIWAFKQKQLPDWAILKHKARLNVHGGIQHQGVNYWETYAPVVNWLTACLTMILSLLKNFKCRQIYFVQAFTQAPIDCPMYMEIPAEYCIRNGKLVYHGADSKNVDKTYVLQLLKNMYGLKQAGYNWYSKITDELIKIGFKQSNVDKCLFIRQDCVIIIYVDNCLIFSKSDQTLAQIVTHIGQHFKITSSNDIETYLGLEVT